MSVLGSTLGQHKTAIQCTAFKVTFHKSKCTYKQGGFEVGRAKHLKKEIFLQGEEKGSETSWEFSYKTDK